MSATKPKILAVVESIDVNDSSGTKVNMAMINSLRQLGYEVTCLHYTRKDIKINGIECIAAEERKASIFFILGRIQRLLFRWFKIQIGERVDRVLGFSFGFFNDSKSIENAIKKHSPKDFQMIWTLSKGNSYRTHRAVLSLPAWHDKWYSCVHDPYPQQLYPRPYNYIPRGYREKRRFFLKMTQKAKRIVLPSLVLKEWLQSYYPAMEGKSLIIPHQIVNFEMHAVDLPHYFNKDNFNLLHAGNLLDLRDPKPLVEAFELFLKKTPEAISDAKLLFLGGESVFTKYMLEQSKELPQLYVSNGYVAFEETYRMQQLAVVNIILEAKSEISPFLPGKFPHCITADAPILLVGPYYSECKRLLGNDYPYKFDFDEIEKIAATLKNLYNQWKLGSEKVRLNRPDLEKYLSLDYFKAVLEETQEYPPV
ncbi:glycosyltransferase family protein [Ulvibacter antarcticus]|uniref:Glycosyltransferase involved in cell wall biosynthesis n=1 Tax=Ulvibacter antarcticus TaxID=442714 RepID=A0A3L9YF54_9FLAO|nr:UDP-glycosyltransferase [Ulvibacter antarcticus]RMA57980.1 glycosyltransferase involved in cell wall biosynthesis [Ulvibacter antarcticus]